MSITTLRRCGAALLLTLASCGGTEVDVMPHGTPRGTLLANPAHHVLAPGALGTSTLTWTTEYASTGQVWVSTDGGSEHLFAEAPHGSQDAWWIQGDHRYVFTLYADHAHATKLAVTSVTTQAPDTAFGFDYWPLRHGPEALTDANWPTTEPEIAEDLDHIASLGGGVLRLMLWPQSSGWIPGGTATFTPDFTQIQTHLVQMLGMIADRKMAVILCFGNNYFDLGNPARGPGHRWWMDHYSDFTSFLGDARRWVNGYVDAIEASPYASVVRYYDYENEYDHRNPNVGWYLTYLYDWSSIPAGKRGSSVLYVPTDVDYMRYELDTGGGPELGHRHLDYVDFHTYPGQNTDLPHNRSLIQAQFPDSTLLVGEFGRDTPASSGEAAQTSFVSSVSTTALGLFPMALNWMLWNDTPGAPQATAMAYDHDHPKDVLGWTAATHGILRNADFEAHSGGAPVAWSGGGTVAVDTLAEGPWDADAATGQWYGRVRVRQQGAAWLVSDMTPVTPGKRLYVNAYVRSSMASVSMDIHEYDAAGHEIHVTSAPPLTPDGWRWRSYLHAVGSFSVPMRAATRSVIVAFGGHTGGTLPAYIDVDACSAALR